MAEQFTESSASLKAQQPAAVLNGLMRAGRKQQASNTWRELHSLSRKCAW